ncbi:hypothetical protein NPS01_40100 [Nocardioides psychrotolerans]|uniref:Heavy-metal-associated domain-containing protein n=1 Tax=Nocardioides psychrotolerans TaxID=1005945 RepID=A0A1I3RAB1_9ACTN|nr:hypothetical protein [Nocardioides psychrotolerans]GEP40347.1 hypothetical protein NPS01_40100 [Nocardioides psychrotolerans]SFJ42609.1 hypothetical protein SAMN05216561_13022 [Nocardioides psychrotolerans]
MNTPTTVGAFVVGLAGVFGATYGIGNAVGPVGSPPASHATGGHMTGQSTETDAHAAHGDTTEPADTREIPGGLMVSQGGYTLDLQTDTAQPGNGRLVEFTVTGPDGEAVTEYEEEHGKELHLIAVRRDFTGFQHVHPRRDRQGIWSVPLDMRPGQWRLFADFTPARNEGLTLGADLQVPGNVETSPETPETRTARVDDYTVTLAGTLTPGSDAELTLSVSQDGEPVTNLQPYLGAYGHLVALREGDLAYLHVHPDGAPGDGRTEPGPEVVFYAAVPSDGGYHLYLNFKHDGVVHTAAFNVATGDQAHDAASPAPETNTGDGSEHEDNEHGH